MVPLMALLTSCTSTDKAAPGPEPTTSVSAAPSTSAATPSASSTPTTSAQWPTALSEHDAWYGSTQPTWAVYLTKPMTSDDQAHQGDLTKRLTDLGYPVIWVPIGFHSSAQTVFGDVQSQGSNGPSTLTLFFADEQSAKTFVASWGSPVVGVASGSPTGDFD